MLIALHSRTRKGHWERSVMWGMLKNPAYMGRAAFRKTRQVERKKSTKQTRENGGYPKHALSSSRDRPEEDWIFIPVPAIIDESTFYKVQERLQENKKLSPRNNTKYHYLLSGLLSCKRCGYSLYGKPASNSRYKRCYYRCMGQDGYRWPTGRVCDGHPVRVEVLDELVWHNVEQLIRHPQLVLQEYIHRLNAKHKQQLSVDTLLNKKDQEIRQQDVQKQRLLDLYQAGSIRLEEIQERLQQIRTRIQHIEEESRLLQREQEQQFRQLQLIEQFEAFQQKLDTNLSELRFEQKKALVRLLVKEVIVDAVTEEIIIRHTLPLDNTPPPDHAGNSGRSDSETQHDALQESRHEISQNIENKKEFEEALQKSFPLCKGSNCPTLRGSLVRIRQLFPIQDAHLEPFSQQTVKTAIFHTTMQQVKEYRPVHHVDKLLNIHIENPAEIQAVYQLSYRLQGVMRTTTRTKPVRTVVKVHLKDRFQKDGNRLLDDFVFQHQNADWTL